MVSPALCLAVDDTRRPTWAQTKNARYAVAACVPFLNERVTKVVRKNLWYDQYWGLHLIIALGQVDAEDRRVRQLQVQEILNSRSPHQPLA